MNEKTKEYRKSIAEAFIKSLTEKPRQWKKEWSCGTDVHNGKTGSKYSGLNRFWLTYNMLLNKYEDPRFYTFKQVQDMGLKVKQGSKSVKIEFWSFYDPEAKKKISYQEAQTLRNNLKTVVPIARYYSVFNGEQIEGLEKYEMKALSTATQQELIETMSKNMGVELIHGGDKAFYRVSEDKIYLPHPKFFVSQEAYNGTALHELAHATGAKHRLNRVFGKGMFSEEYAREELVAEITSCFTQRGLQYDISDEHFENHKAYVQSWISMINEKPEILMQAIKDADAAANYMEMVAEINQDIQMEDKMLGTTRNTVYIKVNEAFVQRDVPSQKEPGGTYNKVVIPQNTVIDGKEIGGFSFCPKYIMEDPSLDNVVNIPWRSEESVELRKGEEIISVEPSALKEILNDSFRNWKQQLYQNIEKEPVRIKEKEEDIEI